MGSVRNYAPHFSKKIKVGWFKWQIKKGKEDLVVELNRYLLMPIKKVSVIYLKEHGEGANLLK